MSLSESLQEIGCTSTPYVLEEECPGWLSITIPCAMHGMEKSYTVHLKDPIPFPCFYEFTHGGPGALIFDEQKEMWVLWYIDYFLEKRLLDLELRNENSLT